MGAQGWREIGVRRLSRWTAVVLALGACLSALPVVGAPWSFAAVLGYASFGYVPAQCGRPSSTVQALNGDVIRVCQTNGPSTTGFFAAQAGFGRQLQLADTSLTLDIPGPKLSFSCCARGANLTGTFLQFTPVVFEPVTLGDPLFGSVHYSAASGGTTYATVTQTATLAAGASGYQLAFAITNTSGAPLSMRPVAQTRYYNGSQDLPIWSTSAGPRQIVMRSPLAGGSVTVTGSTAGGSPDVTGFTAGSGTLVFNQATPVGSFDNVLHGADGTEPSSGSAMAVDWTDHVAAPLPAGSTAHYTLNVALQQPRSLGLALHDPATPPSADAATTMDAIVTDDRNVSGRTLRWRTRTDSGTATLDNAGRTAFAVPPFSGTRTVIAYVDIDDDGVQDLGEESAFGFLFAPRATAPPAVTPPPPPVTPPPPVAPLPPPKPSVVLAASKPQRLATVAKSGLRVSAQVNGPGTVTFRLSVPKKKAKQLRLGNGKKAFVLARATVKAAAAGVVKAKLKIPKAALRRLRHHKVVVTLDATAVDAAGTKVKTSALLTLNG